MTELNQFKEPYNVYLYIDRFISKRIIKWKNFNSSNDLEEAFKFNIDELKTKLKAAETEIAKIFSNDAADLMPLFIKTDSTNATAQSIENAHLELNKFSNGINAIGTKMNIFGRSIAAHDMIIQRAHNFNNLLNKFEFFNAKDYTPLQISNDIDETLRMFQVLHTLKKIKIKSNKFNKVFQEINNSYNCFETYLKNELVESFKSQRIENMRKIIENINSDEIKSFYIVLIHYFQNLEEKLTDKPRDSGDTLNQFFNTHLNSLINFSSICDKIFSLHYKMIINLYIQTFYENQLKDFVNNFLNADKTNFVLNLEAVYKRALKFESSTCETVKVDNLTVENLRKNIFDSYISKYFDVEYNQFVEIFNKSVSMKSNTKTNNFLLQELTVKFIQDLIKINNRCKLFLPPNKYSEYILKIYQLVVDGLLLRLSISELDFLIKDLSSNNKYFLDTCFFESFDQINASVHLIQKFYTQHVVPNMASTIYTEKAATVLRNCLNVIENKIDSCCDKYINFCISQIKSNFDNHHAENILLYKSDDSYEPLQIVDEISKKLKKFNTNLKSYLSAQNFKNFGFEFCVRFTKFIVNYYKEFTFSPSGAFVALVEVRGFKSGFLSYQNKEIDEIFETIFSLLNLLVVSSEQVNSFSLEDKLKKIDPQMIQAYIERRQDLKSSKLKF